MRAAALVSLLIACLALVACGGDDEPERADTTPATAAESTPPPATADEVTTDPTTAETEAAPADEGAEVSRADARLETARQSMLAAEDVPNSDLYFGDPEDVECDAPGATQPDNLNERAPEWTCEIDSETNGVRCQGTARIVAAPGANPGRTFEDLEAEDVEISCEPA